MVQLKKKVTLKTKIADSDVKQDIQPKNTAPQEPVNKTGGGKKRNLWVFLGIVVLAAILFFVFVGKDNETSVQTNVAQNPVTAKADSIQPAKTEETGNLHSICCTALAGRLALETVWRNRNDCISGKRFAASSADHSAESAAGNGRTAAGGTSGTSDSETSACSGCLFLKGRKSPESSGISKGLVSCAGCCLADLLSGSWSKAGRNRAGCLCCSGGKDLYHCRVYAGNRADFSV